jgi:AraC-like DNA-binding protein
MADRALIHSTGVAPSGGTISVVLVRPLALAIGSTGLDAFWAATDLTPEILADDDARLSPAQFCVAWSEAVRLTGDRRLALRIASALPTGTFGIVEYVCRAAPTLGAALRQWVRYLNLLDDAVTVGLVIEGDRACLRVERESEAPAPASHELCWAVVARIARELSTVPFRIHAVELAHPAPGDIAPYRAWFDAPVVFDAPATQLVVPAAALDAALVTADASLLAILTRAADELARQASHDPPLVQQVKRALHDLLRSDDGHVEVVAKRLGLTSRSLQRRLKDEGTSFQVVREELRRELSERYLAEGLAIAEISFLLGFSEPSAFFRAFKRWTGETPLAHRQRLSLA